MEHIVKPLSGHSSLYRQFLIVREPRNLIRPLTRFRVCQGDDCYGTFDALALAIHYINRLYNQRNGS